MNTIIFVVSLLLQIFAFKLKNTLRFFLKLIFNTTESKSGSCSQKFYIIHREKKCKTNDLHFSHKNTQYCCLLFLLRSCQTAISFALPSTNLLISEKLDIRPASQPAFTCSQLTIETLEQGVKYVQS